MRLLSFRTAGASRQRIGLEVKADAQQVVVDARRAYACALEDAMPTELALRFAGALIPGDMAAMLAGGEDGLRALRTAHKYAEDALRSNPDVRAWIDHGLVVDAARIERLAPVPRPGKILAVGSNYPSATLATSAVSSGRPVFFTKLALGLIGHDASIIREEDVDDLDFEGELAVVIGRPGRNIPVEAALEHVVGYSIANDLTRRQVLADERKQGNILFGKSFPGALPCGPVLVTSDEIDDPQQLTIEVRRNGKFDSGAATSIMLRTVAELVTACSKVPLDPGDMILTGAPKRPGGHAAVPLRGGDRITVNISPIGELITTVIELPGVSPTG